MKKQLAILLTTLGSTTTANANPVYECSLLDEGQPSPTFENASLSRGKIPKGDTCCFCIEVMQASCPPVGQSLDLQWHVMVTNTDAACLNPLLKGMVAFPKKLSKIV